MKKRRQKLIEHLDQRLLLSGTPASFGLYGVDSFSGSTTNAGYVVTGGQATMTLTMELSTLNFNASDPPFTGVANFSWSAGTTISAQATPGPTIGASASFEPQDPNVPAEGSLAAATVNINEADAAAAGPGFSDGTTHFYELLATYSGPDSVQTGFTTVPVATVIFSSSSQHLAFVQGPTNIVQGAFMKPAVTVAVDSAAGTLSRTSSDLISLSLVGTGGAITGTTTARARHGIATFAHFSVDTPGQYSLRATDVTTSTTLSGGSAGFTVSPGKLVFVTHLAPTQASADPLKPAIRVKLVDGRNRLVTNEDGTVITLNPIGFGSGNPITGNTAVLTGGIATFSDVLLSNPGIYQLQASDPQDTAATSNRFKVVGDHLVFAPQPRSSSTNAALSFKVEAVKVTGRLDTTLTDNVTVTLNLLNAGSTAALAGITTAGLVGGIADFTVADGISVNTPGVYSFNASAIGADGLDLTVTEAKSAHFRITAPRVKPAAVGTDSLMSPLPRLSSLQSG